MLPKQQKSKTCTDYQQKQRFTELRPSWRVARYTIDMDIPIENGNFDAHPRSKELALGLREC
ncbi:hypothetical protein BVI434_3410006 [Burkholderia vietnamiensis]|nr:hypothetical protein BVI2075_150008 [Burkholderia vietnamiensis]CAG9217983.1 hypothetical protein BVI434_3410006 [Burkholderia vietnamiensis]